MHYQRFDVLLIILVFLLPLGFLTTYLVAMLNGHVRPGLPYISDTGSTPPESCIFSVVLAFGSFLTIIIVYVRYHHVKLCISTDPKLESMQVYNNVSYYIGIISCIGVIIVGSFQKSNVLIVHEIGAFMAFFGLTLFCLLQTFISHKISVYLHSNRFMFFFRLILCFIAFIFSTNFAVFINGKNRLNWFSDDGYVELALSTTSEWALFLTLMIYVMTFVRDFKRIKIDYPSLKDHLITDI